MLYPKEFDVIVVGGGHAGTEAALAAARMGAQTLLLTHNIETLGQMSCNPSIGGIGKGHLVRRWTRWAARWRWPPMRAADPVPHPQFEQGPGGAGRRAQADRVLYKAAIRRRLENQPNLMLFQQAVDDLMVEGDRVVGAVTQAGIAFPRARRGVDGGDLSRRPHPRRPAELQRRPRGRPTGRQPQPGWPELKLPQGRLKTGTPPRLDKPDHRLQPLPGQPGDGMLGVDTPMPVFSFMGSAAATPSSAPCWITHTNERTHEIIRSGFDRSPMFTGDRGVSAALTPKHRKGQGQPL